ncbi:MAG: GAF domain-containing protein [Candidatus Omnitrophica bacterium]|nr:GAF domain-containing protein [Candidatus Omnitrophota bacterium]
MLVHYCAAYISVGLVLLGISIFVIYKNPKSFLNRIFAAYSFAIAWWAIFSVPAILSIDNQVGANWCRTFIIGPIFIPTLFLHFTLKFLQLNDKYKYKVLLRLSYASSILFLISDFTNFFIKAAIPKFSLRSYTVPGFLFHFHVAHFGIVITIGILLLYKELRKEQSSFYRKKQLFYLFWSSLLGYIGGAPNYLLVYMKEIPILMPFGTYTVALYGIIVAFIIVRYQLLDISVAITRTVIFAFVYTFVLGIPFWVGLRFLGIGLWILPVSITVLLASFGPFIFTSLRRQAENILRAEERRYQQALLDISSTMLLIKELDRLLKTIVLKVVDLVKVSWTAVYLKDEKTQTYVLQHQRARQGEIKLPGGFALDSSLVNHLYKSRLPIIGEEVGASSLKIGLAVPCFLDDTMVGFLLLGDKPKNAIYTSDDIGVFALLSNQTALAIENCQFYSQERQREHYRRIATLDRQIDCMAHEIDNPIHGLLGIMFSMESTIDGLKDIIPQDKIDFLKQKLTRANFNARRISQMIDAVKEFSKPTTGEFRLVSLQNIIESFNYITQPQFKHYGIDFTGEIPQETIWLRADKVELEQVIVNLATNSIQAIEEAPKENRRQISLKAYLKDDTLRIDFSDTGSGIEEKLLEDIFLDFVTTKASSIGTGLGLSISRKIIQRHKGKIWAESEGKNKGAAFHIELPVAKDITEDELKRAKEDKEDEDKRMLF